MSGIIAQNSGRHTGLVKAASAGGVWNLILTQTASASATINFTSGFATGISGSEYANILYNSKIVLCPKGCTSSETFRHYEAMRAGCIIISSDLPDTEFYKNAPFIILKDWKKINSIVRALLMQPDKMQELHLATLDWWKDKCNEGAVAKYMTSRINKIIINNY